MPSSEVRIPGPIVDRKPRDSQVLQRWIILRLNKPDHGSGARYALGVHSKARFGMMSLWKLLTWRS